MRKRAIPATRRALSCLPLDDDSPARLSKGERAVVVMYMSCTKLEDIAGYQPWKFVYELRYRIGAWGPLARSRVSAIDNFRYKAIALAVIAHTKRELAELDKPSQ